MRHDPSDTQLTRSTALLVGDLGHFIYESEVGRQVLGIVFGDTAAIIVLLLKELGVPISTGQDTSTEWGIGNYGNVKFPGCVNKTISFVVGTPWRVLDLDGIDMRDCVISLRPSRLIGHVQ